MTMQTVTLDIDVPEGFTVTDYRKPVEGEWFIDLDNQPRQAVIDCGVPFIVIQETETDDDQT